MCMEEDTSTQFNTDIDADEKCRCKYRFRYGCKGVPSSKFRACDTIGLGLAWRLQYGSRV